MAEDNMGGTGEEDRRSRARTLIMDADAARADGADAQADRLLAEATRIDPDAAADAIGEAPAGTDAGEPASDDEEVRLMTQTVRPGSDAPPRAGITGSGSGADDM